MKLLLFVLTLAAAVSGFTTAENNHRNNLPFISKTRRPQLSFASGQSTTGLRETLFKRGSLQKLNLKNQDDTNNNDNKAIVEKQNKKILDTIHIFGTNLILQVFGGAGAIWGFSEVIGFRTPETVWFWRPTAQFVGAIFFARWVLQLNTHLEKEEIKLFFGRRRGNNKEECGPTEESKLILVPRGGDATEE